jgi:hypothetical protein
MRFAMGERELIVQGHMKLSTRLTNQIYFGFRVGELLVTVPLYILSAVAGISLTDLNHQSC